MINFYEKIPRRDTGNPILNLSSDENDSIKIFAVHYYKHLKVYSPGYFQDWLSNKEKVYLYCETVFNNRANSFVFDLSSLNKEFSKDWTQKDWIRISVFIGRKVSLEKSLEEVNASIKHMKFFSDIRKIATDKRSKLNKDLKKVKLELEKSINTANSQVNELRFFKA